MKIIIKLIGVGCLIVKGQLEDELFSKMNETSKKLHSPITEAVFDAEFFSLLNLPPIKHFQDLGSFKIKGLLNSYKSQIEIKYRKIKKLLISSDELISSGENNLLFPNFNIETIAINSLEKANKAFTIVETEIGVIATYQLTTDKFDIQKLRFTIFKCHIHNMDYVVIGKLTYDDLELISSKSDTLVTSNFMILQQQENFSKTA